MGRRSAVQTPPLLVGLALFISGCVTQSTAKPESAPAPVVLGIHQSAYLAGSVGPRRMPPPHERGVQSIAVLYLPRAEIELWYRGLTIFQARDYKADSKTVLPGAIFEEQLLAQSAEAPFVKLRFLSAEEARLADHISYNKWLGTRSIDDTGRAMLAALRARDVDQVLLVEEPESLRDFIFGSDYPLPTKGFYGKQFFGTYVIAGFHAVLIDTATSEEVQSSRFAQVSAAPLSLTLRGAFEDHTEGEQKLMSAALRQRIVNNVKYMLQLLKVMPGDDGAFLTYDPVRDKPGGDDYPQ